MKQGPDHSESPSPMDLSALLAGLVAPPPTTPPTEASGPADPLLPLIVPLLRQELERSLRQALGNVLRRLAENLDPETQPSPRAEPAPPAELAPAPPAPPPFARSRGRRTLLSTSSEPLELPPGETAAPSPIPVAAPTPAAAPTPRWRPTMLNRGPQPPAPAPVEAAPPQSQVKLPPRESDAGWDPAAPSEPVVGPRMAHPTALNIDLGALEIPEPAPTPAAHSVEPPVDDALRAERHAQAESHIRRGNIDVERGRLDDAIVHYTAAIGLAPDLSLPHLNRGLAYAKQKQHSHAAADADEAIRLDPKQTGAYFVRAAARAALGAHEAALADLGHLLHGDPRNVLALNERGLVYAQRRDYLRAIADYSHALAIAPKFILARFNRGVAYRLKGEPQRAVEDLTEAIARSPKTAAAYHQRGLAFLMLEDYAAAEADFTAVLERAPAHAEAAEMLGRTRELAETRSRDAADLVPEESKTVAEETSSASAISAPPDRALPPSKAPAPPPSKTSPTQPSKAPAPPRGKTQPAAQTIRMACPECGAAGQVRPDRLNRLLQCRRCWKLFRVNGEGVLVEFVPPTYKPSRWAPLRKRARFLVPLVASAAILLTLTAILLRPPSAPALAPLPTELEERGQRFGDAWLQSDRSILRRLTLPTHDRTLNAWTVYNRPPQTDAEGSPPSISVRVHRNTGEAAELTITIQTATGKVDVAQTWELRGADWYFVPRIESKGRLRAKTDLDKSKPAAGKAKGRK